MPSTAVKIGSELVDEARSAAEIGDRSMTGQIEHWAKLGRSVEQYLSTPMISILKKTGGDPSGVTDATEREQLLEAISILRENPPFAETSAALRAKGVPLFEADPENPDQIIRVDLDGKRTPGRLIGRIFEPA